MTKNWSSFDSYPTTSQPPEAATNAGSDGDEEEEEEEEEEIVTPFPSDDEGEEEELEKMSLEEKFQVIQRRYQAAKKSVSRLVINMSAYKVHSQFLHSLPFPSLSNTNLHTNTKKKGTHRTRKRNIGKEIGGTGRKVARFRKSN